MKKVKLSTLGSLVKSDQQVEQYATHNFPSKSWIRIGEFDRNNWGSATISVYGHSMELAGRSMVFIVGIGDKAVTKLHSSPTNYITLARLVSIGGKFYLEIYNNQSTSTSIRIIASNNYEFSLYTNSLPGSIPEGAPSWEYNL